jgi:lipopolysaccharide biosynthesis protein
MVPSFRFVRKRTARLFGMATFPDKRGHRFYEAPPSEDLKGISGSPRLAIFAMYQPDENAAPSYLLKMITSLKSEGYKVVVVNALNEDQRWRNGAGVLQADIYLERENLGMDFGSWCDFSRLIRSHGCSLSNYEEVLLLNDSIVGPLRGLNGIVSKMRGRSESVVGLTDCYLVAHHPQSFFLLFKADILKSTFLDRALNDAPYYIDKNLLVLEMEVGFGRKIVESGYKFGVLNDYLSLAITDIPTDDREILKEQDEGFGFFLPQNPTHYFSEALYRERDFPFVKRELIVKNPLKLAQGKRLATLPEVVAAMKALS